MGKSLPNGHGLGGSHKLQYGFSSFGLRLSLVKNEVNAHGHGHGHGIFILATHPKGTSAWMCSLITVTVTVTVTVTGYLF
jgi:hypothetical protein